MTKYSLTPLVFQWSKGIINLVLLKVIYASSFKHIYYFLM